ncbi:beta-ACP synthase, partial [Bacteroides ovatus]
MEYPLNIYITAHTLISSLGFGIPENLEAIHNYRSGIRMQEAGLISDHPLLAGMIDSVELEKRAKLMQITDYTRMEQLFILAIQKVISQSGTDLREPDCALLLSTTKGNVDLLSELSADSPVFLWKMAERIGDFFGAANQVEVISNACISGVSALIVAKRWIESGRYKR